MKDSGLYRELLDPPKPQEKSLPFSNLGTLQTVAGSQTFVGIRIKGCYNVNSWALLGSDSPQGSGFLSS